MSKRIKVVGLVGSEGLGPLNTSQSGSGVGKDTVADLLVNHYGYIHIKFADMLRRMFYEAYQLPKDKQGNKVFESSYPPGNQSKLDYTKTYNENMIVFAGQQRAKDPNIFVRSTLQDMINQASQSSRGTVSFVISDLRQFNEWMLLRALKGTQVEIWRTNTLISRQKLDCQLLAFTDLFIHNNRSLESLAEHVASPEFSMKENSFSTVPESTLEYLMKGYLNEFPFVHQ